MTARGPYGMTTQLTFNTDISLRLMNYAVSHGLDTREAVSKILGEALPPLTVVPRPAPAVALPPVTPVQANPIPPVVAVPHIIAPIGDDFSKAIHPSGLQMILEKALHRALMQREGTHFHFKNLFTIESWTSIPAVYRARLHNSFRSRVGEHGYPKAVRSDNGNAKKYIHRVLQEDGSGSGSIRNPALYRVRFE